MIDNGKNNVHEKVNNNGNCDVNDLSTKEKICEKKSDDYIHSGIEKDRNVESKKYHGNEKK